MFLAVGGADLKNESSHSGSSIRLFPARRRSVALLLRRRIQLPAGAAPFSQTKTAP